MFRLKFDRFSQATKKSQTSTRKPGMNQKKKKKIKKNIITPPIPGIRINEQLKNGLLDLSATAKDLILKK